ncbi:hypothetical protein GJAV_G00123100 [Gymnothorax javanicus]|nr:hypothetical protein GJAV_G00123100 [Gymnothorax javanicus]
MSKLERIFPLLEKFRLESYYNAFVELGVKDERDFTDSIDDETLATLGLSHLEKNRFEKMKAHIERLGSTVQKSMVTFRVFYTFPKCLERKEITNMDPSQNTLEDLMLRIGFEEQIGNDKAVCLYTEDGIPLTDDPFFSTWSLKDRQIENGSLLYAMFTRKENLRAAPIVPRQETSEIPGDDTVRCHIMLKGDYEIDVDMDKDALKDLRRKLSKESGIPAHLLHARDLEGGPGELLKNLGISSETVVHFSMSSFENGFTNDREFFMFNIFPSVTQTQKGMSVFLSTLYAIFKQSSSYTFKKVMAYIWRLTGCKALTQALYQLMCTGQYGTWNQRIAILEGLYLLFRELLPNLDKKTGPQIFEDSEVFEYSNVCWAYLISQSENEENEAYAAISLRCEGSDKILKEPVRIPGIPSVFDRAYVLDKIKREEKIPGCSEERLKETSMQRATDIERIILSVPLARNFPVAISGGPNFNFQVNPEKTFEEMREILSKYSYLVPVPPLQMMSLGLDTNRLVYISKDNLCCSQGRDKLKLWEVDFLDFLTGKERKVDVRQLANELGDLRQNLTSQISSVPKEAILVLVDASSSMVHPFNASWTARDAMRRMIRGYDDQSETSWTRIEAVKQLFHCFADRTMAYDFPHVIGLVKVGKDVKFHNFTESLETFRTYVRKLEAEGNTPLYDALDLGHSELLKVKECFPNCRLHMLCLTDGEDVGSKSDPVEVAIKLIDANVVVDSVLLGGDQNNVLHGISNVTGGCCFKPRTTKDALKLFEMETVLSLERRKLKKTFEASSVKTLVDLTNIFLSHGHDDKPEVAHPEQLSHKVTLPQNALNKKIQESKSGRFLDKDKRIMEELKHLHVDPHPYCTVFPSETDFSFWKILMKGPPDTSYAQGSFELYCQFGADYPLKPPLVRFLTPIYHCNVNSVGRICHNIFDRDYSAHVTMKEILDAIFGLLIAPEAEDPLDSVLAEEFLSSRDKYEEEAKKATAQEAATPVEDMEKKLVGEDLSEVQIPSHLICKLWRKMFVDPVITPYGDIYERQAIENVLRTEKKDPFNDRPLEVKDLKADTEMRRRAQNYRESLIQKSAA